MSRLTLKTLHHGGSHTVVHVTGPIVQQNTSQLCDHLHQVLTAPTTADEVHIDLRLCTQLDVAGILTLDEARKVASLHGRTLRLVAVPPLIEVFLLGNEVGARLDYLALADTPTPQFPADPAPDEEPPDE